MPKTTAERDYYTITEAAKVLDVSPATVWRWIEAGKLPAFRVGMRSIRIKKQDLNAVVTPARAKEVTMGKERIGPSAEELWADYDPEKVRKAIAVTVGSWADLDADTVIAELYQAREEGSRPAERP